MPVELKNREEIGHMREAGRIVAEILDALEKAVAPGVSTWELDQLAERLIHEKGARPAFKGYRGFPSCLCTSINHEVVHGIPSRKRRVAAGDLLKLDFGVVYKGYFGDSARTIPVGKVSPEAEALSRATRESLEAGIRVAVAGNYVGDIGHAVQRVAEGAGYSVVRELVGHGIGSSFHEEPQVPNYGKPKRGPRLMKGMTIAIEPMVNMGRPEIRTLDDKWTVVTADGSLSAHFEHTVLIEPGGPRLLTVAPVTTPV